MRARRQLRFVAGRRGMLFGTKDNTHVAAAKKFRLEFSYRPRGAGTFGRIAPVKVPAPARVIGGVRACFRQ